MAAAMTTPGDSFDPYRFWLQIPDGSRPPTHYQLLGLRAGERDPEVIRQATLMRSAHVRNFQKGEQGAVSARVLEELSEASRVLLDPTLRSAYDAKLRPPTPAAVSSPKPAAARPRIFFETEPDIEEVPRPRKRRRRTAPRRDSRYALLGIVLLALIGAVAYVATVALNRPTEAKQAPRIEAKQADKPTAPQNPTPQKADANPPTPPRLVAANPVVAPPPQPVPDVIRLTVDPPTAILALEAQDGGAVAKAAIEGDGAVRKIVADKGMLPLVVAAAAPGYKLLRVTIVAADVGRVVEVLLSRETLPDPFASAGPLPSPWKTKSKRYHMARDFHFLLPLSSAGDSPAWRYTIVQPDDDWAQWGFDDSRWAQGQAAFATALGDEFKVRSGRKGDLVSGAFGRTLWESPELWLRTAIDLPAKIRIGQIRWNYRADDAITVFVNGREEFTELRATWRAQRITNPEHFLPGRNVIAVHAVNKTGTGLVDVGFEWLELQEGR